MNSNASIGRANQREGEEETQVRGTKPAQRRKRMPCGATTCLHCHAQCGAVMANYILQGLDEPQDK